MKTKLLLILLAIAPMSSGAKAQEQVSGCVESFTDGSSGARTCSPWMLRVLNGLGDTVTQVKNSAGQLGTVYCYNSGASVAYLQIFDMATPDGVTLGVTMPKLSLAVPSTLVSGLGPTFVGVEFLNGIQVAATTTVNGIGAGTATMDCNVGSSGGPAAIGPSPPPPPLTQSALPLGIP